MNKVQAVGVVMITAITFSWPGIWTVVAVVRGSFEWDLWNFFGF